MKIHANTSAGAFAVVCSSASQQFDNTKTIQCATLTSRSWNYPLQPTPSHKINARNNGNADSNNLIYRSKHTHTATESSQTGRRAIYRWQHSTKPHIENWVSCIINVCLSDCTVWFLAWVGVNVCPWRVIVYTYLYNTTSLNCISQSYTHNNILICRDWDITGDETGTIYWGAVGDNQSPLIRLNCCYYH